MPDIDPTLDPIMVAALIDDDDDEESKELTAAFLKQQAEADDDDDAEEEDEPEDEDDEEEGDKPTVIDKKPDESEDKPDDQAAEPPEDKVEPVVEQPTETEDEKKSRKERRAERRREYIERISIAPQGTDSPAQTPTAYTPLDLQEGEYSADDLLKDRDAYAKVQAESRAETVKKVAEEQNFWTSVEYQSKLLIKDPQYSFLDEKSEDFDEKKAAYLNDLYLKAIGYEEKPLTNSDGYAKLDANGNIVKTVQTRRKDLPYDEFVTGYIDNIQNYVDENEAETTRNLVKQQAHQGVRPGGSSRRGIGRLKLGDMSRMTDEEFDANEAEIDRQINAELGIS